MSEIRVDSVLNVAGDDNPTLVVGTPQATTSGTAFDFTGIPAWVKRVTVLFDAVSLTGADHVLIQLGDAGGMETSGYVSVGAQYGGSNVATGTSSTSGFLFFVGDAGTSLSGGIALGNVNGDTWTAAGGAHKLSSTPLNTSASGTKTLSDTLTQLRVTRSGTNTFNAGQVNILYE